MRYIFTLLLFLSAKLHAQEDSLLRLLDPAPSRTEKVIRAFHSTRVIMSHSVEMLPAGVLDFRILHRFGNVNRGLYEFFGLDQATIRLGLDYGITPNLMVGIGRGSYKKELDGFIKYRPLQCFCQCLPDEARAPCDQNRCHVMYTNKDAISCA